MGTGRREEGRESGKKKAVRKKIRTALDKSVKIEKELQNVYIQDALTYLHDLAAKDIPFRALVKNSERTTVSLMPGELPLGAWLGLVRLHVHLVALLLAQVVGDQHALDLRHLLAEVVVAPRQERLQVCVGVDHRARDRDQQARAGEGLLGLVEPGLAAAELHRASTTRGGI